MSQETIPVPAAEQFRQIHIEKNREAIELLRSWDQEVDDEDQVTTLKDLKRTIDEDRPAHRKHFS